MKPRKTISVIFSVIYLFFMIYACVPASADTGVVRVGYYYSPSFQDKAAGGYTGYGFEYYSEIAQYAGFNYSFVEADFNECLKMLSDGEIDVINGIIKTPELENEFDFSRTPSITAQNKLYTIKDNQNYTYNSFERFNNARIGVLNLVTNIQQLENFAEQNNFSYTSILYSSQEEIENAAKNGETDMIFVPNVLDTENFRIVAAFEEYPLYFAVKKGNPIIHDIDAAMDKIQESYPYFSHDLYEKYAKYKGNTAPNFTMEEFEYIRSNPTIRVAYDPNWRPIEYYDETTRKYSGIAESVLSLVSEYSGLKFTYVKSENFTDTLNILQNGGAEILSAAAHDYNWANENNMYLSSPFIYANIVTLERDKAPIVDNPVIALPKNYFSSKVIAENNPNSKIVYYNSIEECIKAVRDGTANMTYMNNYIAQYHMSMIENSKLAITNITDYQDNLSVAVSKNVDPRLLSIINKSLLNVSDKKLNDITTRECISSEKFTLKTLIYRYPILSILSISAAALLVVIFIALRWISVYNTNCMIKKSVDELELSNARFRVFMKHITDMVLEYDLYTEHLFLLDKNTGDRVEVSIADLDKTDLADFKKYNNNNAIIRSLTNALKLLRNAFLNNGDKIFTDILEGEFPDGTKHFGKLTATAVYNSFNRPVQAIILIEDITESIGEQRELRNKLNLALQSTYDEVSELDTSKMKYSIVYSKEGKTLKDADYKKYVQTFVKYNIPADKQELILKSLQSENLLKMVKESTTGSVYVEYDVWSDTFNTYRRTAYSVLPEKDAETKLLIFKRDIDEQIKERQLLIERSQRDNLTGLYNKMAFFELCEEYMVDNPNDSTALIFLDLDNFKALNDKQGHIKGDLAIRAAADKLQVIFSNIDVISRFGGDEFCVMVKNIPKEKLTDKLEFLLKKMHEFYGEGDKTVEITASVGVAWAQEDLSFGEVLERADKALYKAKEDGKNRFIVYSDNLKLNGYVGRN